MIIVQGYKYNIHYRDVFELYSHQKEIEDTYKQWNQALCEEMKSIYPLLKPCMDFLPSIHLHSVSNASLNNDSYLVDSTL